MLAVKAQTTEADSYIKKRKIIEIVKKEKIEFIRLQFTDIFGFLKNVAITEEEFDKALAGELMFDGSSIDGFGRIEESDMYLVPDLDTFGQVSWQPGERGVAQIFCDVHGIDHQPFAGCPRNILKNALAEAKAMNYELNVGPEGEFFLFHLDEKGKPIFDIHDDAGYFDLSPVDRGEDARRDIILSMKKMGFRIEASHHEVAPGQHEIDFKYDEALRIADKWMSFKQIVKNVAQRHGLYASFIPKPFTHANGNAMHCNQSLVRDGENAFYDQNDPMEFSQTARHYIAGLIHHAKGIAAICNPTVNSYKRLIPGYEAPVNIAWSFCNRSTYIRIPRARGKGTRIELRTPDPTANPYLVFSVMLRAGLDGIKRKLNPPDEIQENIYKMTNKQCEKLAIESYPTNLKEALQYMELDPLVKETLGEHAYKIFHQSKTKEWESFERSVQSWEIDNYLKKY